IQDDGKVLLGGDFTQIHGAQRNYLARLNADGTLDNTFDPGNTLNGPVYALTVPKPFRLNFNSQATGGSNEDINVISVAPATWGTLVINYDMLGVPDQMKVFYGNTNPPPLLDTGMVSFTNTVMVPFGPTNGLTTNVLIIVMNQGGGNSGTAWFY